MITGFNTDVEHNGVVYHVQTEDKGLDSPIILSLVYAGGAILASKRAPYQDLIVSGFSEAVLAERLKRQHKLICAAIYAGRIDDLRKMGMPVAPGAPGAMEEMEFEPVVTNHEAVTQDGNGAEWPDVESEAEREVASAALVDSEATDVDDARPRSPLGELPVTDQGLVVSLLDEQDFRSGASLTVRVLVSQRSGQGDKPLSNVAVSLKVLGTTFRPQIYSTKTQRNGVAIVATRIPQFTSGRAAILVRAVAQGQSTEIRRVVHPGKWGVELRIYVNGEVRDFPTHISLNNLIANLSLGPERVAIELNGLVLPRAQWESTILTEDDRLEIVHFVGGGVSR